MKNFHQKYKLSLKHAKHWMVKACPNKSNLELFEGVFKLSTNIQFERIKDDEYEFCSADEPLHHFVERVAAVLLTSILNNARRVNERDLFQQLSWHFNALQSLQKPLSSTDKKHR